MKEIFKNVDIETVYMFATLGVFALFYLANSVVEEYMKHRYRKKCNYNCETCKVWDCQYHHCKYIHDRSDK